MDENVMRFNEFQLKRSGFADAITPELKARMLNGDTVIEHKFAKQYDQDKTESTLHLKKSGTSDFYFLNKFEVQLQKDGQAEKVAQTFYVTQKKEQATEQNNEQKKQQHENRYTLKEAYNLLSGRPVHKNLINKEGQDYEAWVKLNLKNKLENGNFELKQYHTNYGFELENTLAKYPIKELATPNYKDNLVKSLERGNLQKVTFVGKDGQEEQLYISPNITLGALNVYDQNKQRITTEKLVEKDYIGKELAAEITKRIGGEKKTDQKQAPEKLNETKQEQKQIQSQRPTQKLDNKKKEKKQTNKQKIK
jgi:hypothetical protein